MPLGWKKVLIVEDDAVQREGWIKLIGAHFRTGLQIDPVGCATLEEARRRVRQNNIALILLDTVLEDSSDPEKTLEFIKEASPIPVVVVTGIDDPELIQRGRELGMVDYILKGESGGERTALHVISRAIDMQYPEAYASRFEAKAGRRISTHVSMHAILGQLGAVLGMLISLGVVLGYIVDKVKGHDQQTAVSAIEKARTEETNRKVKEHDVALHDLTQGQLDTQRQMAAGFAGVQKTLDVQNAIGSQERKDMQLRMTDIWARVK